MRDDDALEENPRITRQALEELHVELFGWALSRCNYDREAAEDLVQQAYVELLSGRARFNGESALKTFVFGVVQKLAGRRFRRLRTRLRFVTTQSAGEPIAEFDDKPDTARVWQAVLSLPSRQRDIVELVFCRELTIEQAAAVMGVTVGTGRTHYERAKAALRERLGDEL